MPAVPRRRSSTRAKALPAKTSAHIFRDARAKVVYVGIWPLQNLVRSYFRRYGTRSRRRQRSRRSTRSSSF
jgi:hypothetical protein